VGAVVVVEVEEVEEEEEEEEEREEGEAEGRGVDGWHGQDADRPTQLLYVYGSLSLALSK
jgi:hypothetical protein